MAFIGDQVVCLSHNQAARSGPRKEALAAATRHLDQAIVRHSEGHWEAANSQFRSFIEELFNEIARRLAPTKAASRTSGESMRQLLGAIEVPFLFGDLGECSADLKNFIHGLFKRLHGRGSHPGLSNEED